MAVAQVPDRLITMRRMLGWVLVGQLALLAATGLYLTLRYRPTPSQAWSGAAGLEVGGPTWTVAEATRTAHRWTAWSTVITGLMLAGTAIGESLARWRGPTRRRSGVITGPATLVLLALAIGSGFLLPWDQLALWAVTVGTDVRGFRPLWNDDQVRFVLIRGSEVSVEEIRRILAVHAIVLPGLLAAALTTTIRRGRSHRLADHDEATPAPLSAPPAPSSFAP